MSVREALALENARLSAAIEQSRTKIEAQAREIARLLEQCAELERFANRSDIRYARVSAALQSLTREKIVALEAQRPLTDDERAIAVELRRRQGGA